MKPSPGNFNKSLRYSAAGLELGLAVLLGLFLGQWLDKRFDTSPWLLLVCLIFGSIAGFRSLYRIVKRLEEDAKAEEEEEK